MRDEKKVRIRGVQREEIDTDLMAQVVLMLGRELARRAKQESSHTEAEDKNGQVEAG